MAESVSAVLATEDGLRRFMQILAAQNRWADLTKAQRRALAHPLTARADVLERLRGYGLLDGMERTDWGAFVLRVNEKRGARRG